MKWFLFVELLAGFFAEIFFSLVQLNLSTVYSLRLCHFFRQFSSSSRRWEKLDPTPYVRIMQLIDHKVCRSSSVHSFVRSFARSLVRSFARSLVRSFARSLVRSFARSLVRSFARSLVRSFARSLVRSLEFSHFCFPGCVGTISNVQLPKLQGNSFIHLSLILTTKIWGLWSHWQV